MRTTFDFVDGALWYSVQHPHGARVAKAWADVRNAVEAPVQAWGCWLKWYECGTPVGYWYWHQLYWVGARCAFGCHSVGRFIPLLDIREGDWGEVLGSVAHDMITAVATGHALGAARGNEVVV
jgi:hypothetical protein